MARYPLIDEIGLSPPRAFELFRDEPFSFFLDSGMDPGKLGRFSFIGSEPFLVLKSRGNQTSVRNGHGVTISTGDPLTTLGELLATYTNLAGTTKPA